MSEQKGYSATLEATRQVFRGSELSSTPLRGKSFRNSKQLFKDSQPLFLEPERQLLQCLDDLSQRLRRLHGLLLQGSQNGIWNSGPHAASFHVSLLEALFRTAMFLETLACYPLWQTFPDTMAPNTSTHQVQAMADTSQLRHRVASVLHKFQYFRPWPTSADNYTINTLRSPQRPLPFTNLPPQIQGAANPLWYSPKSHLNIALPNHNPLSAWPPLKTALLASGYRTTLLYITAAILLNHTRHTFTPWLASYPWPHPLEDLRLARSNPDVFLSDLLSTPWPLLLLSPIQRYLTTYLLALTTANPTTTPPSPTLLTLALTHTLTTLEYIPTLLLHTTAVLLSIHSLLTGPPTHQLALQQILSATFPNRKTPTPPSERLLAPHSLSHVLKTLYILVFLSRNLLHGVAPLIRQSFRCARRGQLGLLMALLSTAGFTSMLLRYRSTFFIALQVHRMFVALGFFILGVSMLCWEFVSDPVGLGESTRRLTEEISHARGLMSEKVEEKLKAVKRARMSADRRDDVVREERLKKD
ncbi:hypothetical protein QBC34DRAFT_409991 [Podospora aff. communis PSN243]|uniref:Uncharacterized protein n=1 Tax=Podospora aff. communis PSN243 TaxID=3040156 RepID=A0AAV9GGX0_9PEZI|nr:hypothetical protein QBC34DRAFT_409991 [Podospora aff. communis PSN243]